MGEDIKRAHVVLESTGLDMAGMPENVLCCILTAMLAFAETEAASARKEEQERAAKTGWLIEHGTASGPMYWTGESWGKWSGDHRRACRFARREDASKVSLILGDPTDWPNGHKVVEHAWGPL